jgi:hypothetical protein
MKREKSNLALIAGICLALAALSAVCFVAFKKFFSASKKKTDEGCCTLEDVQPPSPTLESSD